MLTVCMNLSDERRMAKMPLIRLEHTGKPLIRLECTGKLQKQRGKLMFFLLIINYLLNNIAINQN